MNEGRRQAWARGREIWTYACFYSLALLFLNYWNGFHIGVNDFWANYYQADNQDFTDAATLYDGFFPIGYPTLLRLAPGDDYVEAGFAITAACRLLLIGVFGTIALRYLPGLWALGTTAALSILPRVFENIFSPAADLPMLLLGVVGAGLLLTAGESAHPPRTRALLWVAAGAAFGLSGLVRQHGLVLAAGFMLGALITKPRDFFYIVLCGLACTMVYAPQFVVNIKSGHGLFETMQHVNVYKMMYGVELRDVPLDLAPDVRKLIADDPARFFAAWSRHVLGMGPVLIPAVLAALAVRDAVLRRLGFIVLAAGVPYLCAVALGWSARAVLPMIPWAALLTACLLQRAQAYVAARVGRRAVFNGIAGVALLVMAALASEQNARLARAYLHDHHRYSEVETMVVGQGVVHPKQVYTTDGSLYLPLTRPHWPYFDGTWAHYSLYDYAERYPRLNTKTVQAFARDCTRQGITHVALTGDAPEIGPALGELLARPDGHTEFEYVGHVGNYALYRRTGA